MKLLCSDPHEQPFKGEKFLTQKKNTVERVIQYFANKAERKKQIVFAKMKEAIKKETINSMLINGDFCESSATERGMKEDKDLQAARKIRSEWSKELNIREENMIFNGGNHEFGYILPLKTDPLAGIYRQSFNNFLSFVNRKEIYHSFVVMGFRIILIPYIFSEDLAVDFDLGKEKIKFMEKMKKDIKDSERVIIFLHDPDSLDDNDLINLMRQNYGRIRGVFFGHYHSWINFLFARILGKIYTNYWLIILRLIINILIYVLSGEREKIQAIGNYFRKRKNIPSLIREFKAELIPAPAGFFGIGGGFLILNLFEDGRYQIEKHKT